MPAIDSEADLERLFERLRTVEAPRSLRSKVLRAVGLSDSYFTLDTPLGPLYVAFNERGLSAVFHAADASEFERRFEREMGRQVGVVASPPQQLAGTLREWLAGDRRHALRFDLDGLAPFQQAVLRKTLEIPPGQIRPYSWIAREIGHPRAARAVGTALAKNPIPLFIPCHRVVRGDGRIGRYSLIGPQAKQAILEAEGVPVTEIERLASNQVRYLGSKTTHVFCFPTCRHARGISEQHRVPFSSEVQARAAGYRPCKVCRPAV